MTVPQPSATGAETDPVLREQMARAWSSLLGQADAIADDIALTLLERDRDVYDKVGPGLQADVRASSRDHIRRGLETLAGVKPQGQNTIDLWRETGRRRARQGVPMELVLNAYSLGTRVLWEALLTKRADPDLGVEDHVLLMAGQEIWAALDVQNAVLIEAYRRESARMQRRDLQRQYTILDGLVEGRGADPDFAQEAREVLGIGPEDTVACAVAPYDGLLDEPLQSPEDRLERLDLSSHWHVRGGVYFGLVAGPLASDRHLARSLSGFAVGRVGVAASADGLAGFATAYQLAALAADTLPRGSSAAVAVTDRLPEVLLAGSPQVTPLLVQETLGAVQALPEHQAETLLETLRAVLAHDGSPTHAASALFCHRNTVIYRIKQIEELTGRCLTDPRDKLMLSLGLVALAR
jgi:hypothetical protein